MEAVLAQNVATRRTVVARSEIAYADGGKNGGEGFTKLTWERGGTLMGVRWLACWLLY